MPSRADARRALEAALRVAALGALGTVLWRWTRPAAPAAAPVAEVVDALAIGDALARWTTEPAAAGHAALDAVPDARRRDWLRALAGVGMRVTWSAPSSGALAASAWALADPAGGVRVEVAAPTGAAVVVGDSLAAADTVRARGVGGAVVLPATGDAIVARDASGAATARLAAPVAPALGALLVLGRAGWEAKFVAAALEERGWAVRLRVAVGPGIDVTQGAPPGGAPRDLAPDTATTAAVVVLDSGVVDAPAAAAIARYVRAGGGLVLAGDGARTPGLGPLAAGAVGTATVDADSAPLLPIAPRADAIVLERRDGAAAVAARRVGAGRVVQVGYAETWRRRMADDDDAPAAHRAWWARVVGAAARVPNAGGETLPAPGVSNARSSSHDPSPLAATIAALGPPSAAPTTARRRPPTGPRPSDGALATLAGAALLAEVASRRMRGRT